jgi:hypothetical protein
LIISVSCLFYVTNDKPSQTAEYIASYTKTTKLDSISKRTIAALTKKDNTQGNKPTKS